MIAQSPKSLEVVVSGALQIQHGSQRGIVLGPGAKMKMFEGLNNRDSQPNCDGIRFEA